MGSGLAQTGILGAGREQNLVPGDGDWSLQHPAFHGLLLDAFHGLHGWIAFQLPFTSPSGTFLLPEPPAMSPEMKLGSALPSPLPRAGILQKPVEKQQESLGGGKEAAWTEVMLKVCGAWAARARS